MEDPTCPADEQLVELVEGGLDPARVTELEAHLDRCRACASLIAGYARAAFEQGDEPPPLGPGSRIGRYFVVAFLGAGAMGMVYAAYDPQLDRKVALKLIRRELSGDPERQARLVREAQALARVNHPNVTAVYDAGSDHEQIYLAMELVEGETLDAWLSAERRPVEEIVHKFIAAGRGLAAAHAAGLVHRDFKPTNVLVSRDGETKVTDFGLARLGTARSDLSMEGGSPSLMVTSAGVLIGTPRYMSPEQLAGAPADPRSDQFAFSVALSEALHGEAPFPCATLAELGVAYRAGKAPAGRDPRVPAWLRDVVDRGLALDPARRFPDLSAMLAALAADPRARRRRWMLGLAVTAVVVTVVVAWNALGHGDAEICEGAGREVAEIWNPARAANLAARWRATGLASAEHVAHSLTEALDQRAHQLATMHHEACDATRRRGTQSEMVLDLRTTCLARQRTELEALLGVLEQPDHEVVRDALQFLGSLEPVARCADVETLRAIDRPPIPIRAQVGQLVAELATAKAALVAGHLAAASAPLEGISRRASALHYRPLEAEVALTRARIATARGDYPAATEAASRAVFAAMAGRDDLTVFEACRTLAKGSLSRDGAAAAAPWLQCSQAIAERVPQQLDVQAALAFLEAEVADRSGDAQAAFVLHERALARMEAARGPSSAELVSILNGLAIQALEIGRSEAAVAYARRAVAISTTTSGAEHLTTASVRLTLGYALAAQRHGPEALEVLAAARPVLEREYGADHEDLASLHEGMGDALSAEHQIAAALPHYLRAIEIRRKLLGPAAVPVAAGLYNLGTTLNEDGQFAEALRYLDQALPIYTAANSEHHVTVGVCQLERGRALHALGEFPAALAALELARPILVDQIDDLGVLGELHHLLGAELWTAKRGDEARAEMQAARETYARGGPPHEAARVAAEQWLAAHPNAGAQGTVPARAETR